MSTALSLSAVRPIVGVVEVGSVFRLLVADRVTRRLTAQVDVPLELGDAFVRHAVIEDAAWSHAMRATGALIDQARSAGATEVTALVTGAIRDAVNGESFVGAARWVHRVPIEVVGRQREAVQVYRAAMRRAEPLPALVIVMGLGSLEMVFGHGREPLSVQSLPLGISTLRAAHGVGDGTLTAAGRSAVAEEVRAALGDALPRLPVLPQIVVLAGGAALAVSRLARDGTVLTRHGSGRLAEALEGLPISEVARLSGHPYRAEPWAAAIVAALLRGLGAPYAWVSEAAACDGVVAEWFHR